MPGNLLHGNLQIPALEGDTQKDIKTILNYLYQLQEQLRYTMRNIGEENFNEDELERLSVKITGGAGMAQINAKVDDMGATLSLLSTYTGLNEVVTVDSAEDMTDDSKTYRMGENYYRHNGTEWVEDTNISTAAITLAAINGQSAIKIKADNIDFTGFATFVRPSDLGASGTTSIDGGRIAADTLEVNTLKKRTAEGRDYIALDSGFDLRNPALMSFKDTYYHPTDRSVIGLYGLAFHSDSYLSATGYGTSSNTLTPAGTIQVIHQQSGGTVIPVSLDMYARRSVRIGAQGWGVLGSNEDVRLYSLHPTAWDDAPTSTTMCWLLIGNNGIVAYKDQKQANGMWANVNTVTII